MSRKDKKVEQILPPAKPAKRAVVFLVADKDMEATIQGFFGQEKFASHLQIQPFEFDAQKDIVVESGHDPGVYQRAHEVLRPYLHSHERCVVMVDEEWAGSPGEEEIKTKIQTNLLKNGWVDGCVEVIVLVPEIEVWIWQDNSHVETVLKHQGPPSLRDKLNQDGWWPKGEDKPTRPKEAMEAITRQNRIPRSSSLYKKIANAATRREVDGCEAPSFKQLLATLRRWFPPTNNSPTPNKKRRSP